MFTSLYAKGNPESHIWRSTAREAFDNRAPKDDTLRVTEYVAKGTKLVGEVELPASELPVLERLVQEVDAFGGGRSTGAGRVKLSLAEVSATTGAGTLLVAVALGEDSTRQFKRDVTKPETLAAEVARRQNPP